jgi:hypothetical protein
MANPSLQVLIVNDNPNDRQWLEGECRRLPAVIPIAPERHSEWEAQLHPDNSENYRLFLLDYDLSLSYGPNTSVTGLVLAQQLLNQRISRNRIVVATSFDLHKIKADIEHLGVRYLAIHSPAFIGSLTDIINALRNE